jgi:hypothetical protein
MRDDNASTGSILFASRIPPPTSLLFASLSLVPRASPLVPSYATRPSANDVGNFRLLC